MRVILVILLLSSCVSCGTIGARTSSNTKYGEFYPATKIDFKGIDSVYSESNWLFPPWLIVPFIIIDIPLSIVTDTVFLPVDLIIMATEDDGG